MYRPLRKRNKKNGEASAGGEADNSVKGPNSALTAFLREQGINASSIKDKWEKSQKEKEEQEKEEGQEKGGQQGKFHDENEFTISKDYKPEPLIQEASQDPISLDSSDENDAPAAKSTRATRSRQERLAQESDSDEEESKSRRQRIKEAADSDEEEYKPTGTARTQNNNTSESPAKGKNTETLQKTLKQKKVRKRKAADLLDRRRSDKIRSLQELTIMKISEEISNQNTTEDGNTKRPINNTFTKLRDVLGGISTQNFQQLSKTLCKNRSLNDETLQLFLQTNLIDLEFGDCSKLSFHGYKTLAIFTPNLKHLSLQMCGQLNNEALLYLADHLKDLETLYLDGPFLINEETWLEFFKKMAGRLKNFKVSNTHRFTNLCLKSLLENCGGTLETLGLGRVDTISDYKEIPNYVTEKLNSLYLQHPYNEDDISDEVMIEIIRKVGNLEDLALTGCSGLTDKFITEGLVQYWDSPENSHLKTLNFDELDQLEDEGLTLLFTKIQFTRLQELSLKKCIELKDQALQAIFENKLSQSLISLSINAWTNLSPNFFNTDSMRLAKLQKLNVSFVQAINDAALLNIIEHTPDLKILEVFGCSRVSGDLKVPSNLVLIGRQSDTL